MNTPNRIPKFFSNLNIGEYLTYDLFVEHHPNAAEQAAFRKFMDGQTMSIIEGKGAIYRHDYERWMRQGQPSKQGADWD